MLVVFLLFFVFLIVVRPQDFVLALAGTRIVLITMVSVSLGWLVSPIPKDLFKTAVDRFAGLFLFVVFLSSIATRWVSYIFRTAFDQITLALAYFLVVTIAGTFARVQTITWCLVLFMTVVAGMGVLQAHGTDITGVGMIWAANKGVWQIRGAGLFDNPNDLAYSTVLIVPFAVGAVLAWPNIFIRAFGIVAFGVACYCIYLTQSRGGQLAAGTCMAFWFYNWIDSKALKRLAIVACVSAVGLAFMSASEGYNEDRSAMGRVEAWATGLNLLKASPLIGVGKGQFIEHHERDSHSSYVRSGAETGLLGLYSYLGLLASLYIMLNRLNVEGDPRRKVLKCGYLGYMGSYCVGSIFSTRTYDIVFLVVAALISAFARTTTTDSQTLDTPPLLNKMTFALTAGCLLAWQAFLWVTW